MTLAKSHDQGPQRLQNLGPRTWRQNFVKTNWRVTCIKKPTKNGSDGLNWEKKTNPYSHHIGGILHETDSSTAMLRTGACKEISIFRCQLDSVCIRLWLGSYRCWVKENFESRKPLAKNDNSNLPPIQFKMFKSFPSVKVD